MTYDKYKQYANDVISGKIVTGELIKLSCQRYLSWFDRSDMYFDTDKADKPVRFISKLKHCTGKFNNQPFILQDWQQFLIYAIFGFHWKHSGLRVIRNAYIQISRKCGKTSLASALGLYGLIADGESGAEVTIVAPSKEQSRIGFQSASNYAESINKGQILRLMRDTILFNRTKSRFRIMSSDANFGDGFNPSIAIIDEYHGLTNNDIPNVLISGMGMRTQPLMCYITTAGFDMFCPCKKYRDMCEEILRGTKEDDSVFALIYEIDSGDEWDNEKVWKKSVPSLDITVTKEFLKNQVKLAKNNTSLETGVKTKNINMWCQSKDTWIPNELLLKSSKSFNLTDFESSDVYGYVGIDLASVSDMTAITLMIPYNQKFYFKTWLFLPESCLTESVNSDKYQEWKRKGLLNVTTGNVTDYDFILSKLIEINKIIPIQKICYDSWNSTQFAISATEVGLPLSPYSQALGNFNKPTKEFERLIKSGKVILDNNEIVRWSFGNVSLKYDHNENCKPVKSGEVSKKIDAVISILESLGGMLEEFNGSTEILCL